MPAAGDNITVFQALANLYVNMGKVFEGSINNHVFMGAAVGIEEETIRTGFKELQKYGLLSIDGDIFTPTERMLKKFL